MFKVNRITKTIRSNKLVSKSLTRGKGIKRQSQTMTLEFDDSVIDKSLQLAINNGVDND